MQCLFMYSVLRGRRDAWRHHSGVTGAVTADTAMSQLPRGIEGGLDRAAAVCGAIASLAGSIPRCFNYRAELSVG